ncbi:uncharacterized protein EI90DRAFT_3091440 [Cantharellus anzutake]|uniref:uncharacterized protein n=1 Tax=Cantharellus anzutake TaxID=1750568 RepID=UPI0019035FCE|nr:uncharacterized protein EI90DRAFT_3091440 [Cantharellus anzutake]KAF8313751.1 hypothetical protein EI90DRAFT_3091440 [Cantharellus anzutake]
MFTSANPTSPPNPQALSLFAPRLMSMGFFSGHIMTPPKFGIKPSLVRSRIGRSHAGWESQRRGDCVVHIASTRNYGQSSPFISHF